MGQATETIMGRKKKKKRTHARTHQVPFLRRPVHRVRRATFRAVFRQPLHDCEVAVHGAHVDRRFRAPLCNKSGVSVDRTRGLCASTETRLTEEQKQFHYYTRAWTNAGENTV